MKKVEKIAGQALRFRRFARKNFAVFCSLHKVVNIGVITASTLLFALPDTAQAQEVIKHAASEEETSVSLDEVEVTASRAPMALNQAARIVTVISAREIAAAPVTSIQDLLEYAAGVDVRQRGEGGTQADISIRGGTFDQIAVLLNGVNLSNPQTGHYSFDIPVNLSDIERIEIISGPASRIFGASAFAGAINIITKAKAEKVITTDVSAGMHEWWKLEAGINHQSGNFSQRLSAGYNSSGGYTDNTDFKILNLFWQGVARTDEADLSFQAGINDKGYGANSFYSAAYPNQYDKTRRYFLSAGAETKGRIRFTPKLYWTRHTDRFELFRDNPASWYTGHNYHESQVFGSSLNASTSWVLGQTTAGTEFRNEGIRSNVLGTDLKQPQEVPSSDGIFFTKGANRSNLSFFLEHNILLKRFTLSAGLLANYHTDLDNKIRLYPGIDASYRIGTNTKVYGSWNRSLRMPTFTDLYYKSKTNIGNPNLLPEESEAFELGIKYGTHFLNGHIAGFYRKGSNMIDWVKQNPDDLWESKNLTEVNNLGIETNITFLPEEVFGESFFIKKVSLGYSYIDQDKSSEGYISNYALDYLKHKFSAQVSHKLSKNISATWYVRWQDRAGSFTRYEALKPAREEAYAPYCVADLNISYSLKKATFYAEVNNLFDAVYYDLGNIPQPGIWFKAGFNYTFSY